MLLDIKKAGYCATEDITRPMPKMTKAFIEFMKDSDVWQVFGRNIIADVGEWGYKAQEMSHHAFVVSLAAQDFNFDKLSVPLTAQTEQPTFRIITCFETIEHVQNPLLFVKNIIEHLSETGSIFLSTPARPRFLWTEHHFFEMDAKHLQKWILNPLDLEIVRKKRVHIGHHWTFYFKGIRPFFRLFLNWTYIYEIKRK